jgi:tripartite-type tricarboxylate transporter receptor subunit TctC
MTKFNTTGNAFVRILLFLCSLAVAQPLLAADRYRIIMPFAAGGASEVLARMMAQRMQESLGLPVIVENIVGANGNIGASAAAKAVPDGKTMLITSEAYTTVNPLLFKAGMNYDPAELDPLMLIAVQPAVLAVKADSDIRTLADFVRKAKADGVSYASAGIGSTSHLTTGYFASVIGGLKLTHVPFTGGAPAINAIIGGHVEAGFIVAGNVLPFVRSGKLRALAVSSEKRLSQLPDVSTIAELGYPSFVADNGVVLLVPARTPPAIKQQLTAEARKATEASEVRAYLEKNGYFLRASTSEDAKAWLASEKAKWTDLIVTKDILKD